MFIVTIDICFLYFFHSSSIREYSACVFFVSSLSSCLFFYMFVDFLCLFVYVLGFLWWMSYRFYEVDWSVL